MPRADLAAPGSQAAQQSLLNLLYRTGVIPVFHLFNTGGAAAGAAIVPWNCFVWLSGQIYLSHSSSSVFRLNTHHHCWRSNFWSFILLMFVSCYLPSVTTCRSVIGFFTQNTCLTSKAGSGKCSIRPTLYFTLLNGDFEYCKVPLNLKLLVVRQLMFDLECWHLWMTASLTDNPKASVLPFFLPTGV